MAINVLSAGAAKGLVTQFTAETGVEINAQFNTVGAIKEKFLAEDPCDVLILTDALIEQLIVRRLLRAASQAPLGTVHAGIAVPETASLPDISTVSAFCAALKQSEGIYIPDGERSTAGSHFVKMLTQLAIAREVAPRLHSFENGDEAMRHLAAAAERNALGCTQITEIKHIKGLRLVGPLPAQYDLSTTYMAAVSSSSNDVEAAYQWVARLTGEETRSSRISAGFDV